MSRSGIGVILLVLFGLVSTARADEKLECIGASDKAQEQRRSGHLVTARESLLLCVRDACPPPIRRFCEQWLEEVQTGLPTILLRVADASGHDVTAVRVLVDGVVVATQLDGRPLTLDPGLHRFRFEPANGVPLEDSLLIVESQKNRLVTETLAGTVTPVPATPPTTGGSVRHIPAGTWILGAVAVVGVGAFTALAVAGSSSYSGCVQTPCSASTKSSLNLDRALAWTSLGVGALAAVGSVTVYFTSSSPSVAVTTTGSGAFLSWSGRF